MDVGTSAPSGLQRMSEIALKELEKTIGNGMVEMDLQEAEDMNIEQVIGAEGARYAWDDVNNVELPIKLVDEARQEEVKYLSEKTWRIVKTEGVLGEDWKGPYKRKVGGHR